MNDWQHLRQIAYLLEAATWLDGTTEKVFSRAIPTAGETPKALSQYRPPFVLLTADGKTNDDENPGLVMYELGATIVVAVEGRDLGQAALMGGGRSGGQGSSKGRGLLEVEEEFNRVVGRLTGADGAPAVAYESGSAQAVEVDATRYVTARKHSIKVLGTAARYYPPCLFLVGTGAAGSVGLTWKLPPTRYDSLVPVVRYASGATAPTSATAGTGVSGLTSASVSATVTLAAGTWSFAIFMSYDELGTGTADRWSAAELSTTATSVTVT